MLDPFGQYRLCTLHEDPSRPAAPVGLFAITGAAGVSERSGLYAALLGVSRRNRAAVRHGYNGHMGTVNIAELKDQLSSFLHRVRAGEELIIRDRNVPIAKIVPLHSEDGDPEELSLVASGHMTLPMQQLDQRRFWNIGGRMKNSPGIAKAIHKAIAAERRDYARILGHKRDHSHLRTRPKRQRG